MASSKLQRGWRLVTPLLGAFLLLLALAPAGADAQAYLPPAGKIFQGAAEPPVSAYEKAAGKHPAVYQEFAGWGEYVPGILSNAANAHAGLMIHISTASWTQQVITPAGWQGRCMADFPRPGDRSQRTPRLHPPDG
jgi:hypothetical protein